MAKKSKVAHGSKAAFVRANPEIPAGDLVTLAKKQGMSLTAGHIYNIRASDKAKRNSSPPSQPSVGESHPSTSAGDLSRMDRQLRSLILSIGLYRAEQIFSELKASVSRIA